MSELGLRGCDKCSGMGYYYATGLTRGKTTCEKCGGLGEITTELGDEILRVIAWAEKRGKK